MSEEMDVTAAAGYPPPPPLPAAVAAAAGPSAKGEVAFLSHETTFTAPGFRRAAGEWDGN